MMSLSPVLPKDIFMSLYEGAPNNQANVLAAERKQELQSFLVQSSFKFHLFVYTEKSDVDGARWNRLRGG